MLFRPDAGFQGLPAEGFRVFSLRDRSARRREIIDVIHPALECLAADLLAGLERRASKPLHAHLPRLDWPRDYQPFCTWLALSHEAHGYQAGPQLNVGVHADHVSIRLGWDTAADAFGRFEFLCRHAGQGQELARLAATADLRFRVFSAAPWPQGSKLVFESLDDVDRSFAEVRRHGVWWELGRRHELTDALDHVCSAALGAEVLAIFSDLLPLLERFE